MARAGSQPVGQPQPELVMPGPASSQARDRDAGTGTAPLTTEGETLVDLHLVGLDGECVALFFAALNELPVAAVSEHERCREIATKRAEAIEVSRA
jgi:hypothetical protein